MAELSTIARPYAEALFAAARADTAGAGATESWLATLEQIAALAGHPQVSSLVADPNLTHAQTFGLLTGLLRDPLPAPLENFLHVAIENNRLAALPHVAELFRRLKNEAEGAADCLIESAFPLSEAQLNDLVWGLARKFGLKLKPAVKVDPELIGGVRVTVGDHVLDSTVKARLAAMQTSLSAP